AWAFARDRRAGIFQTRPDKPATGRVVAGRNAPDPGGFRRPSFASGETPPAIWCCLARWGATLRGFHAGAAARAGNLLSAVSTRVAVPRRNWRPPPHRRAARRELHPVRKATGRRAKIVYLRSAKRAAPLCARTGR